jgi:hypothetical protein
MPKQTTNRATNKQHFNTQEMQKKSFKKMVIELLIDWITLARISGLG